MIKENDMRPEQQWQFDQLFSDYEAEIKARENAEKEVIEQCRLNAMGSEREAKLMAELAEARVCISNQKSMLDGKHEYIGQDFKMRMERLTQRAEQAEARLRDSCLEGRGDQEFPPPPKEKKK